MTVDWLGLILWVGGFGTLVVVAVTLVRRSERRLGTGPSNEYTSIAARAGAVGQASSIGTAPDADGLIAAYLAGVAGELDLPAADVAEVRAELIDHLTDSIASLEDEGMAHDTAVREALGRLGPAAELGRQLRAAHQSTRRLLAGAGGGVIAAGGGFVLGYLGGFAVGFVIFIGLALLSALLDKLGVPLPDLTAIGGYNIGNDLFMCFILAVGAAAAMRYAVRTSAGLSRRAPRTVAVFWAVGGTLVFGWWALFGSIGQQSWLLVAGEVLIPVAAIAGAGYRIERSMPHAGRWAVVVSVSTIAVLALSVLLLAAVSTSTSGPDLGPLQAQPADLHLDTAAPAAPDAWAPGTDLSGDTDDPSGALRLEVFFVAASETSGPPAALPIAPILANWHDLSFEAWQSYSHDQPSNLIGIDPHYSSPFVVEPATVAGDSLQATFHFERLRDARDWWIVLTGVGPDGHRYRLGDGWGNSTPFHGSAWDWLTAPQ